ncbi:hypothetical protein FB562_0819 [Homoserinimonas aerilata]|uniref:CopC domain-containing protein n=1 Tax=Homoserinimonas aerilata TaxID=1162970 RepID=A0A542YI35_9MICO|nr:copper resistance CopC family protein [Homoserinimonas aerilata]TQL47749.1 hypothetical protein FB562_0819 [Homoserinimonas aerilata]
MGTTSATSRKLGAVLAALALVTVGAVIGVAQPAQAHNSVISTTPTDGDVLTELPERFEVTTSDVLLSYGAYTMEVTDSNGLFYGDGCVAIDGASLVLDAALGEAGAYTVDWQAVSADSHTISGTIAFEWQPTAGFEASVGSASAPVCGQQTASDAPDEGAGEAPADETAPSESAEPTASDAGTESDAGSGELLWILGAAGAIVVAAGATLLLTRRKK